MPVDIPDDEFRRKQREARAEIDRLDAGVTYDEPERRNFFNAVYENANGDPIKVPWADLQPKDKLAGWLKGKDGQGLLALDVACGLGDNAEAIAEQGYQTTGFDVSQDAIDWAKRRFPESKVRYQQADLLNYPADWSDNFNLVHECYTLQALPSEMREKAASAIASLVKPGGFLLVYTRITGEATERSGPPWPLTKPEAEIFGNLGFELINEEQFAITRPDRNIPHGFYEWKKTRSIG